MYDDHSYCNDDRRGKKREVRKWGARVERESKENPEAEYSSNLSYFRCSLL